MKELLCNFLNLLSKYYKSSALLCGLLLAASLPPFYHLWAAFISFSIALYLCLRVERLRSVAALGYWFGFGYFAAGFYWIGNALLVDIERTGWLYPITLLLNGAFFGLFSIPPFMTTKAVRSSILKIFSFAAVWCLCEWLRGFILTGFPWNPVSSIFAFHPNMMQTLALCGTYGLSMVAILIFIWPAIFLNNPKWKTFIISCIAPVGMAFLWLYGDFVISNRPQIHNGKSIMIRLVQPSIPQFLKWDSASLEQNIRSYIELSNGADSNYLDFTLWGETAVPFDLTYDKELVSRIRRASPRYGFLISGFVRYEPDGDHYRPFNSLAVINRRGEIVGLYDKSHLVPFGEYIPFRRFLPKWIKPVANTISEFGRGTHLETIKVDGYPEFAPLICYEIIFSDQIVRKNNKPKWAVVLTNDGWYGMSAGPYQHLVAAQMRAVEEGISIVRSANSGISAIINPYGEITADIPLGIRGSIDALIKPDEARETIFGKYGNHIPLAMSCIVLLLSLVLSRIFKSQA